MNTCRALYPADSIPACCLDTLELRDEIGEVPDDLTELHEGKLGRLPIASGSAIWAGKSEWAARRWRGIN